MPQPRSGDVMWLPASGQPGRELSGRAVRANRLTQTRPHADTRAVSEPGPRQTSTHPHRPRRGRFRSPSCPCGWSVVPGFTIVGSTAPGWATTTSPCLRVAVEGCSSSSRRLRLVLADDTRRPAKTGRSSGDRASARSRRLHVPAPWQRDAVVAGEPTQPTELTEPESPVPDPHPHTDRVCTCDAHRIRGAGLADLPPHARPRRRLG